MVVIGMVTFLSTAGRRGSLATGVVVVIVVVVVVVVYVGSAS